MDMQDDSHEPEGNSVSWTAWFGMAGVATAILAGLEFMVYRGLAPIERGEKPGAAVWEPIAFVYDLAGFGAAMSVIPGDVDLPDGHRGLADVGAN